MFSRALISALLIAITMVSISIIMVAIGVSGGISITVSTGGKNLSAKDGSSRAVGLKWPCDIDQDGDCDTRDYDMAVNSIDRCVGQKSYRSSVDADQDGCVTLSDIQRLFPVAPKTKR